MIRLLDLLRAHLPTVLLVALIAVITAATAINLILDPEYFSATTIAFGLALTVALVSALRYPVLASAFFVVIFAALMALDDSRILVYAGLAPVFAGLISWHGRTWLTAVVAFFLWVFGIINPETGTIALDSTGAYAWGFTLVAGILVGLFRGNAARSRKQIMLDWHNDVRTRRHELAETLHNSVAASLTTIVMRAEALGLEHAKDPRLAAELDTMSDEVRAAMAEVRAMVRVLKSPTDGVSISNENAPASFTELIARQTERLQGLNREVTTRLDGSGEHAFPADTLTAITELLSEACLNAVKYSPAGSEIVLTVEEQRGQLVITVDNQMAARGLTSEAMSSKLGTTSMERIAATIDARVAFTQYQTSWSTCISVPLPRRYSSRHD